MHRTIDPITLSVIRGGMMSLCYEMGQVVEKTSYSPIFTEGQDYSCALFDGRGDEVAQHAFDPNHMSCMRYGVEWSLQEIGKDNLEPGDVIFCNDPYRGGNHINDCTVYKPVFYEGRLVALPAVRPHLLDLGGAAPGGFVGDATEIFQEGLRIPPVKLLRGNRFNDEVLKLVMANVRDPRATKGDIDATIGALNVAERRVGDYVKKYGVECWESALEEVKDSSERVIRRLIDEIPDGGYEAEDHLDDDGVSSEPLRLRVRLTVRRDTLIADFEGTSAQARGPINATYAVTAGHTGIGVFHCLGLTGDVVVNEGSFRPIKVLVPPGSVLNANYPAPCVAGNFETGPRVADLVVAALLQGISPERGKAGCAGTQNGHIVSGRRGKRGEPWMHAHYGGGGQGARATKDGNSGIMHWATNNKSQSVEALEKSFPIMYEEFGLLQDSGGPGRFRGGIGCVYRWRLREGKAMVSSEADRIRFSPFGAYGGLPPHPMPCGHASDVELSVRGHGPVHSTEAFNRASPGKWTGITIDEGDAVQTVTTGGGGYGDPLQRDLKAVYQDLLQGYISADGALRDYGAVVDEKGMRVDVEATGVRRSKILRTRLQNDFNASGASRGGTNAR